MVSNWSRTRVRVAGVAVSSSTVPMTAGGGGGACQYNILERERKGEGGQYIHTLKLATQQNIDPPKHLHGFGDGGAALAHGAAIAADPPYAVLPALAVLAVALALVDQLAELGAALVVLDLGGRQAGHDVVAMGQQQPDQPDAQRRERRREEPGPRRVVRGCVVHQFWCARSCEVARRGERLRGTAGSGGMTAARVCTRIERFAVRGF
jgi:hypothetical protein